MSVCVVQVIYFCVADMCVIDPMYQYSLEWFINIFICSMEECEKAGESNLS